MKSVRVGRRREAAQVREEKNKKQHNQNLIILTHCNMTKNILERDSTASYVCLEERAAVRAPLLQAVMLRKKKDAPEHFYKPEWRF